MVLHSVFVILSDSYMADTGNRQVRVVTNATDNSTCLVTRLAGGAGSTVVDGTGTRAVFPDGFGIAVDSSSNIYTTEVSSRLVRKVTPALGMQGKVWVRVRACTFLRVAHHAISTSDSGHYLCRKRQYGDREQRRCRHECEVCHPGFFGG